MNEWYYSGLEGLCKGLSKLSADRLREEYPDLVDSAMAEPTLAQVFAREIFNDDDRFDSAPNATRTWRLARDNRVKMFLKSWGVAESGAMAQMSAMDVCKHALLDGDELTCANDLLLGLTNPGERIAELLAGMGDGFSTERFRTAEISMFTRDVEALVPPKRIEPLSEGDVRAILPCLVAAAIFGPAHPLALSPTHRRTYVEESVELEAVHPVESLTVALTQIYDRRCACLGASVRLGPEDALFIGRSTDVDSYLDKLSGARNVQEVLEQKRLAVFPISDANARVSSVHGVIFHNGSSWVYGDLLSRNGTAFEDESGDVEVKRMRALCAGDRIMLGTGTYADAERRYLKGATLLFSSVAGSVVGR